MKKPSIFQLRFAEAFIFFIISVILIYSAYSTATPCDPGPWTQWMFGPQFATTFALFGALIIAGFMVWHEYGFHGLFLLPYTIAMLSVSDYYSRTRGGTMPLKVVLVTIAAGLSVKFLLYLFFTKMTKKVPDPYVNEG